MFSRFLSFLLPRLPGELVCMLARLHARVVPRSTFGPSSPPLHSATVDHSSSGFGLSLLRSLPFPLLPRPLPPIPLPSPSSFCVFFLAPNSNS